MNITLLPNEILWTIYSFLDVPSQFQLSSVSKQFRNAYLSFKKSYTCVTYRGSQAAQWFMIEIETEVDKWRREFYSNYQNITEIRSTKSTSNCEILVESRRLRGVRPEKLAKLHVQFSLHNSRVKSLLVGMNSVFDCLIDNCIRADLLIIGYSKQTDIIVDYLKPSKLYISSFENDSMSLSRNCLKEQLNHLQLQYVGPMKDITVHDYINSNIRSLTITSEMDYFTVDEFVTILRAWKHQQTKLEKFTVSVTFHEDLRIFEGFENSLLYNSMLEAITTFEVSYCEEWFWTIEQLNTNRKANLACSQNIVNFYELNSCEYDHKKYI